MKRSLAGIVLLMSWRIAWGTCLHPTPKVCSEFFRSDAVFLGAVTARQEVIDDEGFIEGWIYKVRLTRTFKGGLPRDLSVHVPNDSGRLTLDVGREYVLFASEIGGRLEIVNDCGPASDPDRKQEVIREIQALHGASGAVIEGETVRGTSTGPGVPGVIVTATGVGKVLRARTDRNGEFRVRVPPRRYRVAVNPDVAIPSDLTLDDPDSLELKQGQCAQIQFLVR